MQQNKRVRKTCLQTLRDNGVLSPERVEENIWGNSRGQIKDYIILIQQRIFANSPDPTTSPAESFPTLDDMMNDMKQSNPLFAKLQQRISNKGLFYCRFCKTKITNFRMEQTRSADEGGTIIGTCPQCNLQTRQHS